MKPETYYREDGIELYCGDCLEIMKELPDKSIDLVLTDPPYGVDLEYASYNDTEENWFKLMGGVIPEMQRIAKMVIFPSARIKRMRYFYDNFEPDWLIVWDKGSPGIRSPIGFNDYELLIVYGKNNPTAMHDIIRIGNTESMGNYGHPCPKPIRWAKWIINRASKKGDTILDPFMGSGTTGVACKERGRNFIGIEIDKGYCDIAVNRIKQATEELFC